MRTSAILAVAASSLAAAAPVFEVEPAVKAEFNVTKFVFGCTVGCSYSFNVTVDGVLKNHPEVKTPVTCSGGLDEDKDYKECGKVSDTQSILAFIVKETNMLKLQYAVKNKEDKYTYRFYGEKEVYSATGDKAKLQKEDFIVPETTATSS